MLFCQVCNKNITGTFHLAVYTSEAYVRTGVCNMNCFRKYKLSLKTAHRIHKTKFHI